MQRLAAELAGTCRSWLPPMLVHVARQPAFIDCF
jgi:hypothetical protein